MSSSMVHASYKCHGSLYTVERIDDYLTIDSDADRALRDTTGVDIVEYTDRMEDSVNQQLAYRVMKDGLQTAVMYNRVVGYSYEGVSIYCEKDSVAMLILLKSMFEIYPAHKLLVMPYADSLKYFISMATSESIREYHLSGKPLVLVKAELEKNGPKLFTYMQIECL